MYLVFTRMPGESYRRLTQVFVAVLVLRILSPNSLPCLLIADFADLAKYYTCPECWTLWLPSCNQPQKARAICRDREIGQHFAFIAKYDTCARCWTPKRPSCNQPQKARTSYWKLKLELENYKDCSLVSGKTCLALSPC